MLNSMKKRDSNYCRETIRGLLSKTRCRSKLMDQQSTAVSFPIPFSCTSVLSNHLTWATQAGSVQLARSPDPTPFHRGYHQQLHLNSKKWFLDCLWHKDLMFFLQGKCPLALLQQQKLQDLSCLYERIQTTCSKVPISSDYSLARCFSNPWAGNSRILTKAGYFWNSKMEWVLQI